MHSPPVKGWFYTLGITVHVDEENVEEQETGGK